MRILYYDCFAGISGDMNLAALLHLGVEPEYLANGLSRLGLDGEFALELSEAAQGGMHGLSVHVRLIGSQEQGQGQGRTLAAVQEIVGRAGLAASVKKTALTIFRKVAEAEARVHGQAVATVHFHELGALDSIVDAVGAALCLERLAVDEVWAAAPELGGGTVRCAHGLLPVPAPATEAILAGMPTRRGGTDFEATTPTGAAILAATVARFTSRPAMTVRKTGYGIGQRQGGVLPNVLRVHLADVDGEAGASAGGQAGAETVAARLLQCNLDDMSPEQVGALVDLFLDAGAMDVHLTPIVMKKNRPAVQLSLLCAARDEARFRALVLRHTTSFGLKSFPLEKTELERRMVTVPTEFGPVAVKEALLAGQVLHAKPEFEDCRALAARHDLPLATVMARVMRHYGP